MIFRHWSIQSKVDWQFIISQVEIWQLVNASYWTRSPSNSLYHGSTRILWQVWPAIVEVGQSKHATGGGLRTKWIFNCHTWNGNPYLKKTSRLCCFSFGWIGWQTLNIYETRSPHHKKTCHDDISIGWIPKKHYKRDPLWDQIGPWISGQMRTHTT